MRTFVVALLATGALALAVAAAPAAEASPITRPMTGAALDVYVSGGYYSGGGGCPAPYYQPYYAPAYYAPAYYAPAYYPAPYYYRPSFSIGFGYFGGHRHWGGYHGHHGHHGHHRGFHGGGGHHSHRYVGRRR